MVRVHFTLLFVSLVLTTEAAVAQEARFLGSGYVTRVGGDPPYEFLSVNGSATRLGLFQGMRTIRNFGRRTLATTTLLGSRGDSITFESEVEWDKGFVLASGYYVITGGTGRFQGATGFGAESVGPFDPAKGARTLTWEGIIGN